MDSEDKLNQVISSGIHDFGHTQVIVEYIEDEGDWAVIAQPTGDFIATSFFSAKEALEKAAWLAGGHEEMDDYIASLIRKLSPKEKHKLR